MKILVVDDDESILCLLYEALTNTGYHDVTTARSGKEALEFIAATNLPFDCFLVDIQMPELDGVSLVSMIRQTPGYLYQPVVMLTAMHEKKYLDKAFNAGATDYISKPFDILDLRTRIHEARKIAREKAAMRDRPFVEGELKDTAGEAKAIRLSDPVRLEGVESAIDYRELENYVLQLSRCSAKRVTVFAVKIGSIDRVYAGCTSEEFVDLLRGVATVVKQALLGPEGLLCYRGDGTFLCINEKRLAASQHKLEDLLREQLHSAHTPEELQTLKLFVGEQISQTLSSEEEALSSLSYAVENVEQRYASKKDVVAVSKRLITTRLLSNDQRRIEQRTYDRLLRKEMEGGLGANDAWHKKLLRKAKHAHREK
ncbi:response regulator [Marimonas lutisalis]|uniref:response regulator n=1 Tax=Marimonas lutisalis TaxID=2545756 RepID=UPI0013763469|nr:response regulator [Marimonas lutisalis]